jgi:hypothetical protein
MRRSRVIVFAGLVFSLSAFAAACSLDEGGVVVAESPDGSIAADGAGIDAPIIDAQTSDSPIATTDGGSKDGSPGVDSSIPFDAGVYFCGPIAVANCATDCPLAPHDCPSTNTCVSGCFGAAGCLGEGFQCDACGADGGLALSRCETGDASAFSECLVGLNRCACPGNDVSKCVGMNQTCENNQCFECGEVDASAAQNTHQCEKGAGNNCHISSGTYGACY